MRTKTLLCAAALAAGVATSMAQSNVYSLNVVGYVNQKLEGDFLQTLICNPLNNTNNNITNIFSSPPFGAAQDGAQISRWNPVGAANDFAADIYVYDGSSHVWRKNGGVDVSGFVLKPGEAVMFLSQYSGGALTNTYVGEVVQGSYSNFVYGGFSQNALGSSAPLGGSFTNSLGGYNPGDGDQVYRWDQASFDIGQTDFATYDLAAHVWRPPSGIGTTILPNIGVAEGLFYINQNADQVWIRNFTVQ